MISIRRTTVDLVDARVWDSIAPSFYQSHAWISLEAEDATTDSTVLLAARDAEIVSALPVYAVEAESSSEYDPRLVGRGLWAGSFLLIGGHRGYHTAMVGMKSKELREADELLVRAALDAARQGGHDGVLALWATEELTCRLAATGLADPPVLLGPDVAIEVPPGGFDDYVTSLGPARTRKVEVKREERKFAESGLAVEIQPLESVWEECARLLGKLQAKSGASAPDAVWREILKKMSISLPKSVVFLASHEGQAVGFSMAYIFGGTLAVRATGFDYEMIPAGAAVYFNLAVYQPVRFAAKTGLRRVHLGRDSYPAKTRRGAEVSLLWGVHIPRPGRALSQFDRERHNRATIEILRTEFVGNMSALDDALARVGALGWL